MEILNQNDIIKSSYSGARDSAGLPQGYGTMEYTTKSGQLYRYIGTFSHGKRQGYGFMSYKTKSKNPVEEWEWYQEGEYDSAGRLIHPKHEPGSYEPYIDSWGMSFEGLWRNDEPLKDCIIKHVDNVEVEIAPTQQFLSQFISPRRARNISPAMVERLRESEEPCAKYAYGVWLLNTHADKDSLQTAEKALTFAAENGIADALQVLSVMHSMGDIYNPKTNKWELNLNIARSLNDRAMQLGSERAKLDYVFDLFHGDTLLTADKSGAIAAAKEALTTSPVPELWHEHLAWFYEEMEQYEEAEEEYMNAIIAGQYSAISNFAILNYSMGYKDQYYDILNWGARRGVPSCMMRYMNYANEWDDLKPDFQSTISFYAECDLNRGIRLHDTFCMYIYAFFLYYENMDFKRDIKEAVEVALKGANYHNRLCCSLLAKIMSDPEVDDALPKSMQMEVEEILLWQLRAVRYGLYDDLEEVVKNRNTYVEMGYGDEIDNIWIPLWEKRSKS